MGVVWCGLVCTVASVWKVSSRLIVKRMTGWALRNQPSSFSFFRLFLS